MLINELQAHGRFLFRWRSYLPLLLIPIALAATFESGGIERALGISAEYAWEAVCIGVSFSGLVVRAMTVGFVPAGTSGRNTQAQVAETINTTGMYSIVRNPLYLGNFLILLGCVLRPGVLWFVVLICVLFALYYERIIFTEEAFLREKFGGAYVAWASKTPAFIPNIRLWKQPAMPFSLRTVLRREYSGLYTIAASQTAIELACDVLGQRQSLWTWIADDYVWKWFFCAATVAYLSLRALKRHTSVLAVAGR